jgi:hypothetical protein
MSGGRPSIFYIGVEYVLIFSPLYGQLLNGFVLLKVPKMPDFGSFIDIPLKHIGFGVLAEVLIASLCLWYPFIGSIPEIP